MEVISIVTQYFYVLYNKEEEALYIDNQFVYTKDLLMAEHYNSEEEANNTLKYFADQQNWEVKLVTAHY